MICCSNSSSSLGRSVYSKLLAGFGSKGTQTQMANRFDLTEDFTVGRLEANCKASANERHEK